MKQPADTAATKTKRPAETVAVPEEANEFLMYSGNSLGPQLHAYEDTPSLFGVVRDHFFPGLKSEQRKKSK
jgi:hypothetical protein